MLHRVIATYDVCISAEIHMDSAIPALSAVGGSVSTLQWLDAWSKKAPKVLMGSIQVSPLGMGHDTGITRPHILVSIPPTPWMSVAASAKATLTSSCKPMFNAHKTQAGCGLPAGGECLPVTAEPTPFVGVLIGTVCGGPVNTPASLPVPLIPTQISVYTGMTWGDIIAGVINIVVDMAVSFGIGALGGALGGGKVAQQIISVVVPVVGAVGKAAGINLDVSIDNPGRIVQEAIDDDGVGSAANPQIRVFGFGVQGTGSKGGRVSGVKGVTPFDS
ncbi:MAG: hypothetical protein U0529_13595 [Thermoanaerobaculia bacterium]